MFEGIDKDQDGLINLEEFTQAANEYFEKEEMEMVDDAFKNLDNDQDEILNMDELFNGFLTNSEIYLECGEELK